MLRVSSQSEDADNVEAIVGGNPAETSIPGASTLIQFAEAALGDDASAIQTARESVIEELGAECAVEAAGVIANFQRMVRIADGTGIPLDDAMTEMTAELRDQLGINSYASARNTLGQ